MKVTRGTGTRFTLQGMVFTMLFIAVIGLLGWLSTQYRIQSDWTAGARNSVSDETRTLLDSLDGPVSITAYIRDDKLVATQLRDLVGAYQRIRDDISLAIVNPDTVPAVVRELGISGSSIVIEYNGGMEMVQALSEVQFTNALLRLSRQEERWIVFVTGHGERKPFGETNYGLGRFGKALENKGIRVQSLNLSEAVIPNNTNLLVLASPQVNLLPGEVIALQEYVRDGGNLLWLAEPEPIESLEPLADQLGISFLPGVIVDATGSMFGVDDPTFVVVTGYPRHESTAQMTMVSLFPETAALDFDETSGWEVTPLLTTLERAWTELGKLEGEIRHDEGTDERAGPLDIGVVLTRDVEGSGNQQRVMVIGDGDFLSNSYLGNAGNLDLGMNLVHWLSHDEAFIDIQVRGAPDTTLQLGRIAQAVIGVGFLFVLPLLLLLAGLAIWLRRRRA